MTRGEEKTAVLYLASGVGPELVEGILGADWGAFFGPAGGCVIAPWDGPKTEGELRDWARRHGLGIDRIEVD